MSHSARCLVFSLGLCLGVAACQPVRRAARFGGGANCAWRVCLTQQDAPSGRSYRINNGEPVPVTVGLSVRALVNLVPPVDDTVRRVVPPNASHVITLAAVERGRPMQARVSISIDLGASTTVPDSMFTYAVPFGGSNPRPLVQGFDGEETHVGSMRYSLDFAMPQGTPVLAARAGRVLLIQDGFTEGGSDPRLLERANLVVVAHSDYTMASYGHLLPGLSVSAGDSVREGQQLGFSGRTGFAGQPHLHFHVGLRMLGEPGRTIPVKLRDRDGEILEVGPGAMVPPARVR
jgi:murein DD-endopeptidase MepM/ murein hydrolase activator NlpD